MIDRTRQDAVPFTHGHRHRFAGDSGLINLGSSRLNESIHGNSIPWRDHDEVPHGEFSQSSVDDPVVASHPNRVREESHQVGESVTTALHGEVLEDLGDEHECGDHECGDPFTDRCRSSNGTQHR